MAKSDNVLTLVPNPKLTPSRPEGTSGGDGGEPPGGDQLEARVATLEKAVPEIREKLVRIETQLENLTKNMVTKTELVTETSGLNLAVANFRTEITRLEGSLIKWYIVTAIALSGGIGAIAFGLARSIK